MHKYWRDLSVSKKLYAVVGVMALLIATELLTLLFAMNVLTAIRSFVGGEGLWSKGQKDAVHSLHRYAFTGDPKYYAEFNRHLEINMGDRQARIEMAKPDADLKIVADGFRKGGNHPDDIPGLIWLIRKFYWVEPVAKALDAWHRADTMIDELLVVAARLDEAVKKGRGHVTAVERELNALDELNERLTAVENEFSEVLGAGSRRMEKLLMIVLILAVLTVESTGVILTIAFSRNLNRSLKELTLTAREIGQGNFKVQVPVRSKDELGQLAISINKMAEELDTNVSGRLRAESANQVKSQFLASMSHEIRTPLGVIMGLAEILKDPDLTWQDQMRFVETIERTGQNLTRIINDILDLSKVEAGHLEIQRTTFALADFLDELYGMLSVHAQKTGNILHFVTAGNLPERIVSDRTRLRQILVNLINNALKYTERGQVHLEVRAEDGLLVFEVRDTGRGIGETERARIFEAFTRTDDAESGHAEGTGLGLMLSKQLARALGGDVVLADSQVGKGSVFRATVALESAAAHATERDASAAKTAPGELGGRRVLVVEDSEDNQLLVKLLLTREGLKVDFANDGREGVEKALHGPHYDVVLMDMQMPVMDGYQATARLREAGYRKPIIALTAHAMKEDRERCLRAGCTDYLTKPVDSKLLAATISRHLREANT